MSDRDVFPVPPPELVEEMLGGEPAKPASPKAKPLVAVLEFVGAKRQKVDVALQFPFIWEGQTIEVITVRRLLTFEFNEIAEDGSAFTQMDIYGKMTGLPAAVLRGLDAEDGARVIEVAYDFLPQALRGSD